MIVVGRRALGRRPCETTAERPIGGQAAAPLRAARRDRASTGGGGGRREQRLRAPGPARDGAVRQSAAPQSSGAAPPPTPEPVRNDFLKWRHTHRRPTPPLTRQLTFPATSARSALHNAYRRRRSSPLPPPTGYWLD